MIATAADLRGLHDLHRRARALRDRLESGPKTLAARRRGQNKRQLELDQANEALRAKKAEVKAEELQIQGQRNRVGDLRTKLNTVKKNDEYKAIMSEIAMINKAVAKQEEDLLALMQEVEDQSSQIAAKEAEIAKHAAEIEKLRDEIETKAEGHRAQLSELEVSIRNSESVVPEDDRERYRRDILGRSDDAFAAVDSASRACEGCFQVITLQAMSELMADDRLVFCKSCGRILYIEG